MKTKTGRLALSILFLTAAWICLAGFGPEDVVEDQCRSMTYREADCAPLVAEGAGEARNVILLIGDGMGIGQTYAGRVFINGPDDTLAWEELPFQGLVTTCAIGSITDSAAAGTALATGHKTKVGAISMGPGPKDPSFPSILEQVKDHKATGLVSSTSLWDATPAVFAAHVRRRTQSVEIARQMVEVTGVDVMLGGGAEAFTGGGQGPDLVARAPELGYHVVRTAAELAAMEPGQTKKLLGLFARSEMKYEIDRAQGTTEPHLSQMAAAALAVLDRDPRGFFLMIEGARIDHACHASNMDLLLGEMTEFDRTVNLVLDWANDHPGTLVLITADHETGGIRVQPGDYRSGDRIQVRWTTKVMGITGHSSQQVPIYGTGPNAGAIPPHLDNTEVYCLIKNAFGSE